MVRKPLPLAAHSPVSQVRMAAEAAERPLSARIAALEKALRDLEALNVEASVIAPLKEELQQLKIADLEGQIAALKGKVDSGRAEESAAAESPRRGFWSRGHGEHSRSQLLLKHTYKSRRVHNSYDSSKQLQKGC